MPIDYSKFDKIGDDSDDEGPAPQRPAATAQKPASEAAPAAAAVAPAQPAPERAPIPEEHKRPLTDVPKIELPEGAWTKFYSETLTAPQRMQTMVHLWNSAEQEERVIFLRHLIDLIGDPSISNRIKGGQEVLKDLDTKFYEGVTYPEDWVTQFQHEMETDDKKVVLEKLFKALDNSERGLVLGTLM